MGEHSHKKAKRKVTWSDWIFRWGMLSSGLMMVGSSCPAIHSHYSWISDYGQAFGQRFVVDRRFSLFSATSQHTQWISWFKYKTLVCRKAEEYLRPSAKTVALNMAGQMFAMKGSSVMGMIPGMPESVKDAKPGGAILGCAAWDVCKHHAMDRCYEYSKLAYGGVCCFGLITTGAISAMTATILQVKDIGVKKKKKKEPAERKTTCAGCIAFTCCFLGFVGWLGTFYSAMSQLNRSAYYPVPNPSIGMYAGMPGLFIMLIAMICGFTRQTREEEKEAEEENQDEAFVAGEQWASMPSTTRS